jgi:hypothetical protein
MDEHDPSDDQYGPQYGIQEERDQGPTPSQQMALLEKARGASVQTEEQVMSEVQKGNLIPMSQKQGQQ